ncbi:MAG: hypothetical protein ABI743_06750, partial [bacterium]
PAATRIVAIAVVLAVLVHQMVVMVLPGVLVWLVLHRAVDPSRRQRLFEAAAWLVLPLLALYALVQVSFVRLYGTPGFLNFSTWATRYSHTSVYWWWERMPAGANPVAFLASQLEAAHARLLYATPFGEYGDLTVGGPLADWGQSLCSAPGLQTLLGVWLILASIGGITLVIWAARKDPEVRAFAQLVLLWGGPLFVFLLLFQPQAPFYRLFSWPLVLMLLLMAAERLSDGRTARVVSTVLLGGHLVLLIWLNFSWGWLPRSERASNPYLAALPAVREAGDYPWLVSEFRTDRSLVLYLDYWLPQPVRRHLARYTTDQCKVPLPYGEYCLSDDFLNAVKRQPHARFHLIEQAEGHYTSSGGYLNWAMLTVESEQHIGPYHFWICRLHPPIPE